MTRLPSKHRGHTSRARAKPRDHLSDPFNDERAVAAWLDTYKGHTHIAYRRESRRFLEFLTAENIAGGVRAATPEVFERYAHVRAREASPHYGLQVLRSLYANLCERGILSENPVPIVKAGKREQADGVSKHFTPEELATIGEAIDAIEHEPGGHRRSYATRRWIFWLLVGTGVRREEIAASARRPALTMSDVHCLRIGVGHDARAGWMLGVRDIDGKLRHIPFGDALVAELVRYRQSLNLSWHPRPDDETPLIVGNGWKPMGAHGIYVNVQRMFEAVAQHLRRCGRDAALAARLDQATPFWLTQSFREVRAQREVSHAAHRAPALEDRV